MGNAPSAVADWTSQAATDTADWTSQAATDVYTQALEPIGKKTGEIAVSAGETIAKPYEDIAAGEGTWTDYALAAMPLVNVGYGAGKSVAEEMEQSGIGRRVLDAATMGIYGAEQTYAEKEQKRMEQEAARRAAEADRIAAARAGYGASRMSQRDLNQARLASLLQQEQQYNLAMQDYNRQLNQ